MNKVLIFLFALITFAACKKDTEPQPAPEPKDLGTMVAGKYTLTSFRYTRNGDDVMNVDKMPATVDGSKVSGTAVFTKSATDRVDMAFKLVADGEEIYSLSGEDLEVRKDGSEYGLFAGETRIADVDGSMVIFNLAQTDSDGEEIEVAFIARKK